MDVRLAMFLASIISLLPTFGMLTLATWWYERKLDEKDLNITYIIGIFIGIIVVVAHIYFSITYGLTFLVIPVGILLSLGEVLLYRIYANRKKFRGRTDVPFMIFSFSLGISGAYLLFISGQYFANFDIGAESFLGLVLFAVGVPAIRGGTALIFCRRWMGRMPLHKVLAFPTIMLGLFNILAMLYLAGGFLWPFSAGCSVMGVLSLAASFRDLSKVPDLA
ncbi:MAG: hypothetical protein QCI82_06890 [Candidatus Thermoplasmatota archaeon]|nr:hypothetical protein [Candidatus Thermoplasmatota archaeon]